MPDKIVNNPRNVDVMNIKKPRNPEKIITINETNIKIARDK